MNRKLSFSIWYVFLAIWAVILVHDFIHALQKVEELPYSRFKTLVATGKVAKVSVSGQILTGKLKPEGESKEPQFVQIQAAQEKGDYSEETACEIDCEVRRIIDEQYARVKQLLGEKKAALQEGATLLLEREVITGGDLKTIMDKA